MGPPSEAVNLKYLGPDAVHFDVRQRGWDESIELGMDRFELMPPSSGRITFKTVSLKRAAGQPPLLFFARRDRRLAFEQELGALDDRHVDHLAVDRDSADAFGERLVVGSDDTACMVDLGGAGRNSSLRIATWVG